MLPLLAYSCCGWACSRVCRQRRRRWGSRRIAVASRDGPGIRGGCRPNEDGGGVLAASFWGSTALQEGVRRERTAVVVSPPRRALSLVFANGVGPARTAVVLTLPLPAYACCGCASSSMCRQRGRRWLPRRLALCFSLGLFPLSSPSRCRPHRVVVIILVLGTLLSSWRALAGAGYLLRGGCG